MLVPLQIIPWYPARLDPSYQIQEVQSWNPCECYSLPYGIHAGESEQMVCVNVGIVVLFQGTLTNPVALQPYRALADRAAAASRRS